jgi:hypothetical protein
MKDFSELNEQELLALAISLEEEDNRTYSDIAEAIEKSRFGRENPRKSKEIQPLISGFSQRNGQNRPDPRRGPLPAGSQTNSIQRQSAQRPPRSRDTLAGWCEVLALRTSWRRQARQVFTPTPNHGVIGLI